MPRSRLYRSLLMIGVAILPAGVPLAAGASARKKDEAPPEGWASSATARIRRAEYEVTFQSGSVIPGHPGGLQAANRRQDLRAYFLPEGVSLVRRTEVAPSWSLLLSLRQTGARSRRNPVAWAAPESSGHMAIFRRGDLLERWENTEEGILFQLDLPGDTGDEPRVATLDVATSMDWMVSADGGEASFYHDGDRTVRLTLSRAVDAQGRDIRARLEASRGSLQLVYGEAEGPAAAQIQLNLTGPGANLTGRGLSTTPDWMTDGNQAGASYGWSTATAGDVNADGYSDVLIGAKDYDNGETDEGRAWLYLGSPTGLSTTASWMAEADQAGAKYGISVSTAGDVNGDGYSDVIVGAQNWDAPGRLEAGKAYLYLGSAAGLSATPVWTIEGAQGDSWLGDWVADAGDVNGDGLSDVIIGAYRFTNGEFHEGRVYVYTGTASGTGLALAPIWFAESNKAGAEFGQSVGTAGDVNGDGYSDIIVGALQWTSSLENQGRAYVYFGSPTGPSPTPSWSYQGDQANAYLGFSVGPAGDVNGDGYGDVVVGADLYDNGQTDEGRAYLFMGSSTGLPASPSWMIESNQAGSILGKQVGTAGDVNGDGYSDLSVGVRQWTNSQLREGSVWIYLGSPTGPAATPDWMSFSGQSLARFGGACVTAGDVNGDGFSDVIVGASLYDNNGQNDEGRAYLYLGSSQGLSTSAVTRIESDRDGAHLGVAVARAGDVNGDGYGDVVLGADGYDNGEVGEGRAFLYLGSASGPASTPVWSVEGDQPGARLGASVARAGDVNGDGYGDLIVGAPGFDNGQTDEGRALVYVGSASGLATTPIWSAEGDQDGAALGAAVSAAGEIDGDGFEDILVGAPGYENGQMHEGRAYLYRGSAAGPGAAPAWIAEGDQEGAELGFAVTGSGDVDGDGYDDVVIGAPDYDNGEADEGVAVLHLGGPLGLAGTPAWVVEGNQAGAHLGAALAFAQDVNGDGYSDVILGAPLFDIGAALDSGQARLYLGSAAGLQEIPVWTSEVSQAGARLGSSVDGAGDVNGDGYSDVIVGAPGHDNGAGVEGRAFVYSGSITGVASPPVWAAGSNQTGALFGASVAAAGDVNGDGFSDVLVGAPGFHNGQIDEGGVFLFAGNSPGGLPRQVRQVRSDGSAPIVLLGASDAPGGFRIAASARSPMGRSRVRLEWEVKPLGVPFDGTGLTQGSPTDTGAPGGAGSVAALIADVSGLPPLSNIHWRVRVRTSDTFFLRLPWFSPSDNGPAERDLRTGGCRDLDGDGYGSPSDATCFGGLAADCDDARAAVYPGAPQTCDGLNNDCLAAGWPSLTGTNETDNDGDTFSTCAGDCRDDDASAWGSPGEATELTLTHDTLTGLTSLTWLAPVSPGGTELVFDTLRSAQSADFVTSAACAETGDGPDPAFLDAAAPDPDGVFYYLVRPQNGCPGPDAFGPLGFASDGAPTPGRSCP